MPDITDLYLFGLSSDKSSSEAQDAFLQELDLLSGEVDGEERMQAFPAVTDLNHSVQEFNKTDQQPASLPATSRRRKVPTLYECDWASYKNRIVQLHIRENRPLKEVRAIMENEVGFCAVYVHSPVHTMPSNAYPITFHIAFDNAATASPRGN
jgi:hypothetical protein